MTNKILIGLTALIVIGAGAYVLSRTTDRSVNQTRSVEDSQEAMEKQKNQSMEKNSQAMDKDEGATMEKDAGAMMAKAGTYKDYSPDIVATEFAAGNKVVLFFHAPWCPFCRAADAAFKAKADQIPSGVTILKTDYDSSTELKKKYGVTYQHTFVQIDQSGNEITQWSGGDIDNLKKYTK